MTKEQIAALREERVEPGCPCPCCQKKARRDRLMSEAMQAAGDELCAMSDEEFRAKFGDLVVDEAEELTEVEKLQSELSTLREALAKETRRAEEARRDAYLEEVTFWLGEHRAYLESGMAWESELAMKNARRYGEMAKAAQRKPGEERGEGGEG